ncbi:MAG: hypothetical protein Q9221_002834 [Calogaya cf. arnoldii]
MSNTPNIKVNVDFSNGPIWIASTKTFKYKQLRTTETLHESLRFSTPEEYLTGIGHLLDAAALRHLRDVVSDQQSRVTLGSSDTKGSWEDSAFALEMGKILGKISGWQDELCILKKELSRHMQARRLKWRFSHLHQSQKDTSISRSPTIPSKTKKTPAPRSLQSCENHARQNQENQKDAQAKTVTGLLVQGILAFLNPVKQITRPHPNNVPVPVSAVTTPATLPGVKNIDGVSKKMGSSVTGGRTTIGGKVYRLPLTTESCGVEVRQVVGTKRGGDV